MRRVRSDADEQNSTGFPETALVPQSGFGKTVPAQLVGTGHKTTFVFGLPESLVGGGSGFDLGKVNWGGVILAIAASVAAAMGALLVMWHVQG